MDARPDAEDRIAGVAALEHPLRRDLFRYVRDANRWVSRDDAAGELGIARSLAAFHLDKLVDVGVLQVRFERLSGRTGPGAGRPSKLYRPAGEEVAASVPDRHYDLAGQVLTEAVARSSATGDPIGACLQSAARDAGAEIGASHLQRDAADDEARPRLVELLARHGYEPVVTDDGELVMENCPFHRLAAREPELVCGMNLDLLSGVIDALGQARCLDARLHPEPGRCCVRIRAANADPQSCADPAANEALPPAF